MKSPEKIRQRVLEAYNASRSRLQKLWDDIDGWQDSVASLQDDEVFDVWSLERDLISPDDWVSRYDEMPMPCQVIASCSSDELMEEGSFGIGHNERVGWFILVTQGQGPCLVWCER